jgi:3-dehydroquinate dehydratase-1
MTAKARIGRCVCGSVPRIAVIIDRPLSPARVAALERQGADIFEIRCDLFACGFDQTVEFIQALRQSTRCGSIGTIRETKRNAPVRAELFRRIIPHVDAVDIEIDAPINREVIGMAKPKTVIVSHHDYSSTPPTARLSAIVRTASRLGADIVKIAASARSTRDVARLMTFAASRRENVVAISMGEYGTVSRVIAPMFGSLYTYAFVSRAVAPGQLSLPSMAGMLRKLYPGYAAAHRRRK